MEGRGAGGAVLPKRGPSPPCTRPSVLHPTLTRCCSYYRFGFSGAVDQGAGPEREKKYKKHVCSQNGAVKNDIKAVEANFRESEKCLLEKKSHSENSWDTAVTNVFRNSNLQGRVFILCNKNRIENTSEKVQLLFIIVVSLTGCVCVSAWCSHTCRDILKTTLL